MKCSETRGYLPIFNTKEEFEILYHAMIGNCIIFTNKISHGNSGIENFIKCIARRVKMKMIILVSLYLHYRSKKNKVNNYLILMYFSLKPQKGHSMRFFPKIARVGNDFFTILIFTYVKEHY
jgi:hypothetical protein